MITLNVNGKRRNVDAGRRIRSLPITIEKLL